MSYEGMVPEHLRDEIYRPGDDENEELGEERIPTVKVEVETED